MKWKWSNWFVLWDWMLKMSRILIAPYKMGSESAKSLGRGLPALRTKATKRLKRDVVLVNWGRSDLSVRGNPRMVLNTASAVARATNKLRTFERLTARGVQTVPWTVDRNVAQGWQNTGGVVYGRTILNGHSGVGIVLHHPGQGSVGYAPLYTKGVLKAHEFRVHVFRNEVLDYSKKRRRNGQDNNDFIKNLSNGWVFCRDNVNMPEQVRLLALKALSALELDFGAIDILYKESENRAYILEINTSPGLQGTTLEKYTNKFKQVARGY